jgi:hypothetical protein
MSFDMFVQRFHADEALPMNPALFSRVFGPYIDRVEPAHHFFHLRAPDGGEADIYAGMEPDFWWWSSPELRTQ